VRMPAVKLFLREATLGQGCRSPISPSGFVRRQVHYPYREKSPSHICYGAGYVSGHWRHWAHSFVFAKHTDCSPGNLNSTAHDVQIRLGGMTEVAHSAVAIWAPAPIVLMTCISCARDDALPASPCLQLLIQNRSLSALGLPSLPCSGTGCTTFPIR
jgi:hypothetical protein